MESKHKRGTSANILMIGIFSLLAVGSWVIFDVYRAISKTTVPTVLQKQIEPLAVDISPELIAKLRSRRSFDPLELNSVKALSVVGAESLATESAAVEEVPIEVSPTPVATESSEASESAESVF